MALTRVRHDFARLLLTGLRTTPVCTISPIYLSIWTLRLHHISSTNLPSTPAFRISPTLLVDFASAACIPSASVNTTPVKHNGPALLFPLPFYSTSRPLLPRRILRRTFLLPLLLYYVFFLALGCTRVSSRAT
ncbi:hypothetical protein PLICRDRAFT_471002 [Plicaturopsis crispa FD-325 SS-3]|nr:hypothetical protein PLICRDRAFT_471002 [Plicaturopsis crispa FD-325 SS-3]